MWGDTSRHKQLPCCEQSASNWAWRQSSGRRRTTMQTDSAGLCFQAYHALTATKPLTCTWKPEECSSSATWPGKFTDTLDQSGLIWTSSEREKPETTDKQARPFPRWTSNTWAEAFWGVHHANMEFYWKTRWCWVISPEASTHGGPVIFPAWMKVDRWGWVTKSATAEHSARQSEELDPDISSSCDNNSRPQKKQKTNFK